MKLYAAPLSMRFWALVIDIILFQIMSILLIVPMVALISQDGPNWLIITILVILTGAIILYYPILETFNHGQTIGKQLLGIRVVRTDGSPASGVACMQRFMAYIIDFGTVIGGLVCVMVTKRSQRFGDLLADTMVVSVKPHRKTYEELYYELNTLSPAEQKIYHNFNSPDYAVHSNNPLALAQYHREIECRIANMRTEKVNPLLIEHLERELSHVHMKMFRHKVYTVMDMLNFTLRSIPRAIYESRWYLLGALVLAVISVIVGVYSQIIDTSSFSSILGESYARQTEENICAGRPMGVYGSEDEWEMFYGIFFNNFMVTLRCYMFGIIVLIGPAYFLINNFVMVGVFETYFAQHGMLTLALVTINQHGILELSAIIIAAGAALRLGCGWLFPGRLSRMKAWSRSARHSMLILLSTIPVLMVAAIIESFITRHTEWPMAIRLSILIITSIIIIVYYVVLPFTKRDQQRGA